MNELNFGSMEEKKKEQQPIRRMARRNGPARGTTVTSQFDCRWLLVLFLSFFFLPVDVIFFFLLFVLPEIMGTGAFFASGLHLVGCTFEYEFKVNY